MQSQAGSSSGPSSSAASSSQGVFRGQGQSLNGPSLSGSQTQTSTQRATPAPPSSPGKRRRIEDDEATQYSEAGADDDIYSSHPLNQSRPGQSSKSSTSAIPLSQTSALSQAQTVEEAMEENWDEDIEDFDDFEAGGTGKKSKVGDPASPTRKFTSFAGPPTSPLSKHTARMPSTPPKQLAPGLPVTPDTAPGSKNRSVTPHGISKWQQIREDPSSPFHARANALLKNESDIDTSPASASTASLLARDRSDPTIQEESNNTAYETPSKTLLPTDSAISPSKSARQASEHVSRFSNMLLNDLETLAKQSESAERQLKAMKQKALYHEKREKEIQMELIQVKEKLKLVMAENEQLRMMQG